MKLFYSVNSPYARKVRVLALEKGLIGQLQQIAVNALENPPELLLVNPLAKVPALVTDDGLCLCDSPIICEYLDGLSAAPRFFPQAGQGRWEALSRMALADGIMDAAVALVVEGRKPEPQRSPEWKTRYENAIWRTLEVFGKKTPAYDNFRDIGEINLAVALGYLNFRHPYMEWGRKHPELLQWYAQVVQRTSMASTMPGS